VIGQSSTADTVKVADKPLSLASGAVDAKSIADAINSNSDLKALDISARAANTSTADTDFTTITSGSAATTLRFYVGSMTNSSSAIEIQVAAGEQLTLDQLISEINTNASTRILT